MRLEAGVRKLLKELRCEEAKKATFFFGFFPPPGRTPSIPIPLKERKDRLDRQKVTREFEPVKTRDEGMQGVYGAGNSIKSILCETSIERATILFRNVAFSSSRN